MLTAAKKLNAIDGFHFAVYGASVVAAALCFMHGIAGWSAYGAAGATKMTVTVADVNAKGLVLDLNGAERVEVKGSGFHEFQTAVPLNQPYVLSVTQQPTDGAYRCGPTRVQGIAVSRELRFTLKCARIASNSNSSVTQGEAT